MKYDIPTLIAFLRLSCFLIFSIWFRKDIDHSRRDIFSGLFPDFSHFSWVHYFPDFFKIIPIFCVSRTCMTLEVGANLGKLDLILCKIEQNTNNLTTGRRIKYVRNWTKYNTKIQLVIKWMRVYKTVSWSLIWKRFQSMLRARANWLKSTQIMAKVMYFSTMVLNVFALRNAHYYCTKMSCLIF